jgi:hypothetical protein
MIRCRLGPLGVAMSLLGLSACYEYRPLTPPAPVGEMVALQITDQGRVSLSERFGPGLAEIQGRVVSNQGNEYVLNVFRVSQLGGQSAAWAGEETRLDRSFIGSIRGKTFSPVRTGLLAGAAAVATYFIISRDLTGFFSGDPEEPVVDPPLSVRIPLGWRFHF